MNVQGQSFGVLGGGISGRAAARLLRRHGAQVFLSDRDAGPELETAMRELHKEGITTETGGHSEGQLLRQDAVVISPGMNPNTPVIRKLDAAGIPVISEIELASRFCRAPIIAVTGTNGKTTTTSLIGALLRAAGKRVIVAGNIGDAFADQVDRMPDADLAVLEISSYQLERIEQFHPAVSIILNITPDHLSRYPTFRDYGHTKMRIAHLQTGSDVCFYNADDVNIQVGDIAGQPLLAPLSLHPLEHGVYVDDETVWWRIGGPPEPLGSLRGIGLTGAHNACNVAAALAATRWFGQQGPALQDCLNRFQPLPHRIELVARHNGVTWINDSKGTNVDAACAALTAFAAPVILIAGGQDKGSDLSPMNALLQERVTAIILTGEAADRMEHAWRPLHIPIVRAADLAACVTEAATLARPGSTVLFSPACASFDAFRNFEDRGDTFRALVRRIIGT